MIKYVIYLSSTQVQITTLITTHMVQFFLKNTNYTREIAMLLAWSNRPNSWADLLGKECEVIFLKRKSVKMFYK
jgi:hypothetical protein